MSGSQPGSRLPYLVKSIEEPQLPLGFFVYSFDVVMNFYYLIDFIIPSTQNFVKHKKTTPADAGGVFAKLYINTTNIPIFPKNLAFSHGLCYNIYTKRLLAERRCHNEYFVVYSYRYHGKYNLLLYLQMVR